LAYKRSHHDRLEAAVTADHRVYLWDRVDAGIWRISDRSDPAQPLHVYVDSRTDANGTTFRVQYRNGPNAELCPAGEHAEPEDALGHAERLFDEVLASR
jgi:hypothetical protein